MMRSLLMCGGPLGIIRPVCSRPFSRQKSTPFTSPCAYQRPRCQVWSLLSPGSGSTGQPRVTISPDEDKIG